MQTGARPFSSAILDAILILHVPYMYRVFQCTYYTTIHIFFFNDCHILIPYTSTIQTLFPAMNKFKVEYLSHTHLGFSVIVSIRVYHLLRHHLHWLNARCASRNLSIFYESGGAGVLTLSTQLTSSPPVCQRIYTESTKSVPFTCMITSLYNVLYWLKQGDGSTCVSLWIHPVWLRAPCPRRSSTLLIIVYVNWSVAGVLATCRACIPCPRWS